MTGSMHSDLQKRNALTNCINNNEIISIRILERHVLVWFIILYGLTYSYISKKKLQQTVKGSHVIKKLAIDRNTSKR